MWIVGLGVCDAILATFFWQLLTVAEFLNTAKLNCDIIQYTVLLYDINIAWYYILIPS